MGYRTTWMTHTGAVARHLEVMLHAIDHETPDGDLRVLVAGVENGGSVEIWQILGADVLGLDVNERCTGLGLPVEVCDVTDEGSVRGVLQGRTFDVILDSTGKGSPWLWPFLRSGGRLILEGLPGGFVTDLAASVSADRPTWLPVEEIMRVSVYPGVTVVEKRNPRVVPYLNVAAGNFADVTGERALLDRGVRWVVA